MGSEHNYGIIIPMEEYERFQCFQRSLERLSGCFHTTHKGHSFFDKGDKKYLEVIIDIEMLKDALADIYASKANGDPIEISVWNT